jgi:hypothetical protein
MTEDFNKLLQSTEAKWLNSLYDHVKETFATDPLPSHNEEHHLRVWNYAKELLTELSSREIIIDSPFLEEMIIAIFFHDTGMSINRDTDHGKESRRLCEKWMDRNHIPRNENSQKMLHAIEYHHDKSFREDSQPVTRQIYFPFSIFATIWMLSVIAVYTGIAKYTFYGVFQLVSLDNRSFPTQVEGLETL